MKEHNCIDRVRKEFIVDYELTDDDFLSVRFDMSRLKITGDKEGTFRTGQTVNVSYQKVNKNGSRSQRETKFDGFALHQFCPWCGIDYDILNEWDKSKEWSKAVWQ